MRKIICVLILCSMLLLSACGGTGAGTEEAVNPVPCYSAEELDVTSNSGAQGIYVMNPDGTFSPLVKSFDGYAGLGEEESHTRYLWLTENNGAVLEQIPHFTFGSTLVLMYNTESAIPESFEFERYEYKGYTLGCHFYRTADSKMYLLTSGTLENTYASNSLSTIDDEEEYLVTTVNGGTDLPLKNIDNNLEMLLGLEGGKQYEIGFYKGTKYRRLTTTADAQVFQSKAITRISSGNYYERTLSGYFIVNMPENLAEGYYYVNGLGMMYYEGK